MEGGYFTSDQDLDHFLIRRTMAELRSIEEIALEATTGDAFKKYVLLYIKAQRKKMGPIMDDYIRARRNEG